MIYPEKPDEWLAGGGFKSGGLGCRHEILCKFYEFTLPLTAMVAYQCLVQNKVLNFQADLEGELGLSLLQGSVLDFQIGNDSIKLSLQRAQFQLYMIR